MDAKTGYARTARFAGLLLAMLANVQPARAQQSGAAAAPPLADEATIGKAQKQCPDLWDSYVVRCNVFADKQQKACVETRPKPDSFGFCDKLKPVENVKCLLRARQVLVSECGKSKK